MEGHHPGRVARADHERALLLSLAMGSAGALELEAWRAIDAPRLRDLAARHQVDALCHWQLRALERSGPAASAAIPAELRAGLRHAFAHHTLRNDSLARDLGHLAGCFERAGVEWLVFKGPWLAFQGYPAPGTRPIDDIDACVLASDSTRAVEALRAAGYRPLVAAPASGSEALRRAHYREQLRFTAPCRRRVELHFRMVNLGPPVEDEAWVWETRRTLEIGGARLHVPGPEAMLLHLTLHANQHGFSVLRLLHDVRFGLERFSAELDVRGLLRRIRRLRCEASVFHALELARLLAGAEVPAPLLAELRPRHLRRWMFSRLWSLDRVRRLESVPSTNRLEAARLYLLELGSPRDKLRYLRELVAEAGGVLPFSRLALRAARSGR